MMYLAYAIMWVAVSAAAVVGLWLTQNPNCLWVFLIPAMVGMKNVTDN